MAVADPPSRQTFVIELATDGDVTGDEILALLAAGGYHVAEVYQPVLRSVANPRAFYCQTCEQPHEPPLHFDDREAFREWLTTEMRLAGCDIRTLSPEGMGKVTVEHMVREGWEVRRTGR